MENPFKRIFTKKKKEDLKKAGRTALVAGLVGVAATEGISKDTKTEIPTAASPVRTHITYENPKTTPAPAYDLESSVRGSVNAEGGGDGSSLEESNPITLASAYFKTGTVEYKTPEAREQAKRAIHVYLTQVDLFGGGLENSTIFVKGQSSRERPTDLNYTLAQKRAEEGLRLVREVLDDYFAGKNVRIEILVESDASVYDGMTEEQIEEIKAIAESDPEEFAKMIDAKQSIKIEAVTKKIEKPETKDDALESFGYVVIDESQSMANDAADVRKELEEINRTKDNKIQTFVLEGGTTESHISTLYKLIGKIPAGKEKKKILVLTDEPDNKLSKGNYETNISYVLGLARDKNVEITIKVFNPDKNEDGFKTFVLNKPENRNKLLAPVGYYEGRPQIDWYKKL
ncbi:MAG: hypothetical protein ACK4FA_01700 [Candidatus Paceibacteria bacterium]